MRGVECGPRRYSFDQDVWHHYPTEGFWGYECEALGSYAVEFTVRGSPDGPDPNRVEMAVRVAAYLSEFVAEAREYLVAFVEPGRFQATGPWDLQGVEFGRDSSDPPDVFEVQLVLAGDQHGLWGVRFAASGPPLDRFVPNQFRRRQW